MIEEYTKAQNGPETVPVGRAHIQRRTGLGLCTSLQIQETGVDVLAKNGGTSITILSFMCPRAYKCCGNFCRTCSPATVADAILQALLEEKGIVEKPSDTLLPPDAIVPDSLRDYEDFITQKKE